MDRQKKQFLMWTALAGVLMLSVGIHDLIFASTVHKSMFVIILGMLGGSLFLFNALMQWRKFR
ncbi:MAG: hypothetical protein R3E58_00875 [Phycisphaerae bacterium]|nr:hypothetical protein [Phycisphaerales bacterium]